MTGASALSLIPNVAVRFGTLTRSDTNQFFSFLPYIFEHMAFSESTEADIENGLYFYGTVDTVGGHNLPSSSL